MSMGLRLATLHTSLSLKVKGLGGRLEIEKWAFSSQNEGQAKNINIDVEQKLFKHFPTDPFFLKKTPKNHKA